VGHYNQAEHISAPRLMNIICSDDLDDDNDDQKNLTWQMIRVLRFANEFPKALYKSPDYLMTIVILQEIMTYEGSGVHGDNSHACDVSNDDSNSDVDIDDNDDDDYHDKKLL